MSRLIRWISIWTVATAITMQEILDEIHAGPFSDTWESLTEQFEVPKWYLDAKFGMYTHWGVYSVPAYPAGLGTLTKTGQGEWFPRNMYKPGSPEQHYFNSTYGNLSISKGYKEFIPEFTGEHFNATQWMEIFHRAGAKFAGPVGEHHDGFAMYNCSISHYNSVNMGPKRDVAGELKRAAAEVPDMHFLVSSHRAWHSSFYDGGRSVPASDVFQCKCDGGAKAVDDADYCTLYCPANTNEQEPTDGFMRDWLLRTCEIIDKYENDIMWFDWWFSVSEVWKPYLKKMAAYYYNRMHRVGKKGVINTKYSSMPEEADVLDYERGQACRVNPNFWQTDTSISEISWGFIEGDSYKSASSIITNLIDIVSKNGALLMNVGPAKNGTIPAAAVNSFEKIGDWLLESGEAVYSSRPFHFFGEGPVLSGCGAFAADAVNFTKNDFRFTAKETSVFAFAMGARGGDNLTIKALGEGRQTKGNIQKVEVLGHGEVAWSHCADGLHVTLPAAAAQEGPAVVAVRGLKDARWDGRVRQGNDGSLTLIPTTYSKLSQGATLDVVESCKGACDGSANVIGGFGGNKQAQASWKVNVHHHGMFIPQVAVSSKKAGRLTLSVGNGTSIIDVPATNVDDFVIVSGSPISLPSGEINILLEGELTSLHSSENSWESCETDTSYFDGCSVDNKTWVNLGKANTRFDCLALCKKHGECQAVTWFDFTLGDSSLDCIGRTDGFYRNGAHEPGYYSFRKTSAVATDSCIGSNSIAVVDITFNFETIAVI